ncbi:TetR/AcrR family transcriptional regulator [Streptomyces collinus]|uniref:TetR/AcrR family transcriptional regulator n=1 Tax=Streptomyces collinus TaxID=42684 RepID=UPI0036CD7F54
MTGAGRRGCPCGLRRRVLRGRPPNTLREHVRNPAAAGRGYADASLDALGSATGLGRGSLYGTFGTKDALFRQCLDRYASIYGAQYAPALTAHPGDPARAVEAFLDVTLSRIADPSVPVGCLIAQSAGLRPAEWCSRSSRRNPQGTARIALVGGPVGARRAGTSGDRTTDRSGTYRTAPKRRRRTGDRLHHDGEHDPCRRPYQADRRKQRLCEAVTSVCVGPRADTWYPEGVKPLPRGPKNTKLRARLRRVASCVVRRRISPGVRGGRHRSRLVRRCRRRRW